MSKILTAPVKKTNKQIIRELTESVQFEENLNNQLRDILEQVIVDLEKPRINKAAMATWIREQMDEALYPVTATNADGLVVTL